MEVLAYTGAEIDHPLQGGLYDIGNKNMPPQNMLLWHKNYFELGVNENRCRKKLSWGFPYLTKNRNMRNEDWCNSPLQGKFHGIVGFTEDRKTDRHKQISLCFPLE